MIENDMALHKEALLAKAEVEANRIAQVPVEPARRHPEFASELRPSQRQNLHYIANIFSQTFSLQFDREINGLTDSAWIGQEIGG